jgi:hypothetical protein
MPSQIQIGAGISIGAGIGIGPTQGGGGGSTTLVITPNDFASYAVNQNVAAGGGAGTSGYYYSGSGNIIDPYYRLQSPSPGTRDRIIASFAAASVNINHVYVFDASFYQESFDGVNFSAGATRKIRISFETSSNWFYVLAIEESNANWTDPYTGTALSGQFVFPLTIDLTTAVQNNTIGNNTAGDWC